MAWIDRVEYALEQRSRGDLSLLGVSGPLPTTSNARRSSARFAVGSRQQCDGRRRTCHVRPEQLGVPVTFSSAHPLDRKLTWEEVRELASDSTFIVAGHSHTHRILEYLPDEELNGEIGTSLRLLEEKRASAARTTLSRGLGILLLRSGHRSAQGARHPLLSERRERGEPARCGPLPAQASRGHLGLPRPVSTSVTRIGGSSRHE